MTMEPVMIYQPTAEKRFRVTWYGGESTQLHFEKAKRPQQSPEWEDRDVRTLGGGVPAGIKEMLIEMENYYHEAIILEQERMYQRM